MKLKTGVCFAKLGMDSANGDLLAANNAVDAVIERQNKTGRIAAYVGNAMNHFAIGYNAAKTGVSYEPCKTCSDMQCKYKMSGK